MAQFLSVEILQEIFKHFDNDINRLHSCLFVNKIWSMNVVSLLWNRPFHLLLQNNFKLSHRIISTYIISLDKEESSKFFSRFVIPESPFYCYPYFLRHLSYFSFLASIQEWCILYNYKDVHSLSEAIFHLFANISPKLESLEFTFDLENFHDFNDFRDFSSVNTYHSVKKDSSIFYKPIVRNWISHISEIELAGDFIIDENFCSLLYICKDLTKV